MGKSELPPIRPEQILRLHCPRCSQEIPLSEWANGVHTSGCGQRVTGPV